MTKIMATMTDNTRSCLPAAAGEKWHGYTIDELRHRRAVSLVRLEMQKAMLAGSFKSATGALSVAKQQLTGNIDGKLKFANYLLIGYKSVKVAMKMWNTFKRSKNKR